MKGEKAEIIQGNCAVHPEEEVKHQPEFENHIGRQFSSQVFVSFPAICKVVDIKFGRPDKFTPFADMTFQNCNCIVERKSQCYREECKKELYVIHKFVEAASLDAFIGKPVTNK